MKKFLTIALLVMALCVVSMAVSAAPTASCRDNLATVTTDKAATAGQAVVLVVEGNKATTDLVVSTPDQANALAADIIYVDQAPVAAEEAKTFTFIPRALDGATTSYASDATVFVNSGSGVSTTSVYLGNTYTVTLDPNGGVLAGDAKILVQDNDTTGTDLSEPTKVGYKFEGWYSAGTLYENVNSNNVKTDLTLTAKWSAYFDYVPEGSEGGLEEGNYEANTDNKVADTGYYTDAEGNPVEYVVSVTTAVATGVTDTISEYGFYIYNKANEKHTVVKGNGTITAGESFYAIAEGIPTTQTDATVFFKPFIKVGENYLWGAGHGFKVNDLKGEGSGKNLGLAD